MKLNSLHVTDELWERIPSVVRGLIMRKGVFLGGGAVRDLMTGGYVYNDYDIFYTNAEVKEKAENALLPSDLKVELPIDSHYSQDLWVIPDGVKIHSIGDPYFHESIEKAFESYDYTACQFAMSNQTLYFTDEAMCDAITRTLSLVNPQIEHTNLVLMRLMKMAGKGYKLPYQQASAFPVFEGGAHG